MLGRLVFSTLVMFVGAVLHLSLNENVVGSMYVLLAGLGFGLLLLGLVTATVYAVKGTLKVFPDYSEKAHLWQERSVWYPLACFVVLCGLVGVSVWNQMEELRPRKVEEWTVTHNGKRPTGLLHFASNLGRRPSSTRVLVLERSGQRVVYAYKPYLERSTEMIEAGSTVRVRLRMGPLGLFRVEGVER